MTDLEQETLEQYLHRLAGADAAPGGGAAAALTGAQAAALLSMVCNLTRADRFPEQAEEIHRLNELAGEIRRRLTSLCTQDLLAVNQLMACYRLPGRDPEAAKRRRRTMQAALREATAVPLNIMETAARLLPVAGRLAEAGNPRLTSDVGVALHLIRAAICSAEMNVQINCKTMQDAAFVSQCRDTVSRLQAELEQQSAPALHKVRAHLTE